MREEINFCLMELGHKSLNTNLLYIQLEKTLFKEVEDNFIVKVTEKLEKIKETLEAEYECEKDGLVFLKKQK